MAEVLSQDRTKNYLRQVKGSVVFKGLAVAASFLAIPLMIRYLGTEQYGVWSTLLSIMSWVVFFDLGVGNGLRNKLAEALAKNQMSEASGYLSTSYSWIAIISLLLFALIASLSFFVPWPSIFNTDNISVQTLRNTVIIAAFFVLLNFWLGLINQVLNAVQKTSATVFGQFIANAIALISVYILNEIGNSSLLHLVIAYGASLSTANILLSSWFFRKNIKLIPKLSFDRQHFHPLLSIGIQFFVIQIAALIIFTTDKILITQLFGPTYVTEYDVVYKLFSIITIIHGLIMAPLWSSYTDAYHREDFKWIAESIRKQLAFFLVILVFIVALCFATKYIISRWIGHQVEVSSWLIINMGVFIAISTWSNIYAYVLNGIGKINVQLYTAVIAMMINIPISIVLVRFFDFGVHGVILGTILSLSIFAIAGPIQTYSIINIGKTKKIK